MANAATGHDGKLLWVLKTLFLVALLGTGLAFATMGGVFWYFSKDLPQLFTVEDYKPKLVTQIYAGGGKDPELVGEFYLQRRYLVPFEKIPTVVVNAFIAAEDDQFFEHPGINIVSILRASLANFKAGHTVQGGSTITQQVVKSLLLTPEKSYSRKVKEIILSSQIEKNLTKKQILYLYLNQIYLGHGAYGVQAAAQTYFRKDVSQLTLPEAAILAGLPQAPSTYSPVIDPQKAKERQRYVLRRMAEIKKITSEQMREAEATAVPVYTADDINEKVAPYYIEHVRRHLYDKFGKDQTIEGGLTVTIPTTKALMLSAQESVRDGLRQVDKRVGYRGVLKHLKSSQEMEAELKKIRTELFDRGVPYKVLLPTGALDLVEAMKKQGVAHEAQLLKVGDEIHAVVLQVDDRTKSVIVGIGDLKAELPMAGLSWAKSAKDLPGARADLPSVPSRVLRRGDLILARVTAHPDPVTDKGLTVSLEQKPQVEGALLSLDVKTGYVLAMVGGYDYADSQFIRATQALRQPGSAFKPFIYSAGVEHGYTPASIIVDSPIVYDDGDTGKWKPANFEEKFYGDTTFRQALIKSRNVPTIKLVQAVQVSNIVAYSKRLGLNSQFPMDLSVALGSMGVSLFDLTKAYTVFPRLGRKVEPIFIAKVADRNGVVLEENKPQVLPANIRIPPVTSAVASPSPDVTPTAGARTMPKALSLPNYPLPDDPDQVLDPRVAYVMTHLMKEVVNYGTGMEAKALGRPAAGKTGTTNDYVDAWFMGFTPHVSTGVWVGFDQSRTINPNETGARAALPIWLGFMKEAIKAYPDEDFALPPGIVFATIDPVSGKLAPANSALAIKEAFIAGTEPTEMRQGPAARPDTAEDFFKEDM